MKKDKFNRAAVVLSCLGMLIAPMAQAAPVAAPRDVALQNGGVLVGLIVDAQGVPVAKSPVSVRLAGKEAARGVTDQAGRFAVANLKGGVYELTTAGHVGVYRLWAPRTAPPASQQGLMLVSQPDLVRAQNCGCCVGCGSQVGCGCGVGGGGGILGWMADHPVITAGAIGAAIAIPLAVDDATP
ncbi:MAG: carboxypeptidase-like regulatory domain-containing protein [Pirellulales bacterium]|nr:carboxypeptidase-like regulatory domain-containing protein [Pirellulales bacterium]